jgi:hypothetical protein
MNAQLLSEIPSYPGYFASRDGRIWSEKSNQWKKIVPHSGGKGDVYLSVAINRGPKRVHRLIAEAWVPNPEGKPEVNHIDGDKLNNRIENLEWVTRAENAQHAYDTGLCRKLSSVDADAAKLNASQVRWIRSNAGKIKQVDMAESLNVCVDTVSQVVRGVTYVGI